MKMRIDKNREILQIIKNAKSYKMRKKAQKKAQKRRKKNMAKLKTLRLDKVHRF